jgi:hypothetical protein
LPTWAQSRSHAVDGAFIAELQLQVVGLATDLTLGKVALLAMIIPRRVEPA